MSRRSRFTALVTLSLMIFAGSAFAGKRTISDPNDVGRHRIDIKSASHGHSGRRITHTIVSYRRFNTSRAPCVIMETNQQGEDDFAACGLSGMINLHQQRTTGNLSIDRPNRKTVVYKFKRRAINQPVLYRWFIQDHGPDECPGCDRAPNNGYVLHRL